MTQVSRYGHMLKVTLGRMRMKVVCRYRVEGSVLKDTIQGRMLGAETTLELDSPDAPERVARVVRNAERARGLASPDAPERVARVVRNAERGCFVMQALLNPVPVTGQTLLNGTP